ncbi:DUF3995 domain-containing protein [Pseudotamlana carrageenivorans]|uniref:DUF3995 domain-containing protein n=1 Tax=Pseudotamlana carrageenivorans TaxID=2069432 RepID=A0A2I7SH06_9FLAO|nr:DUF3995 domain-containing protein [Tamlana carrageenivorans]AUS05183.1 DUF3995 domain-containing protein [Tamlana carrageenivorans]
MIIPLFLSAIFLILALIHFNWIFGGTFGLNASLPTNLEGKRVLNPKPLETVIVGLDLSFFSLFYILQSGLITFTLPHWVISVGGWLIPSIFLLRAIGEFKYVGFFKRIKHTAFGKMDTKLFSPLCLVIAIMGFLVQLYI